MFNVFLDISDHLNTIRSVLAGPVVTAISPVEIPGVDSIVNTLVGWMLYLVSIGGLIAFLIVCAKGYKAYKRDAGAEFMDDMMKVFIGSIVAAYAKDIVTYFYPGFKIDATVVPIPGVADDVRAVIGMIVWGLQILAFFALVFIGARGYMAFKDNKGDDFVDKAGIWIIISISVQLATNIMGIFFPYVLTF